MNSFVTPYKSMLILPPEWKTGPHHWQSKENEVLREDLHEETTLKKCPKGHSDYSWHNLQGGVRPHLFQQQFQKDLQIGVTESFEIRLSC